MYEPQNREVDFLFNFGLKAFNHQCYFGRHPLAEPSIATDNLNDIKNFGNMQGFSKKAWKKDFNFDVLFILLHSFLFCIFCFISPDPVHVYL